MLGTRGAFPGVDTRAFNLLKDAVFEPVAEFCDFCGNPCPFRTWGTLICGCRKKPQILRLRACGASLRMTILFWSTRISCIFREFGGFAQAYDSGYVFGSGAALGVRGLRRRRGVRGEFLRRT